MTEDAPRFLRAVGGWPVLALLPALGLERVWQIIEKRFGEKFALAVVGTVVVVSLGTTIHDYFVRHDHLEELKYWFEDAGIHLAHEANSFLDHGWVKGAIGAKGRSDRKDRRVYVDLQLRKDWLNAHLLIPPTPHFVVPGSHDRVGAPDQAPFRQLFSPGGTQIIQVSGCRPWTGYRLICGLRCMKDRSPLQIWLQNRTLPILLSRLHPMM